MNSAAAPIPSSAPRRSAPMVPPAGPAWAGSLMGTAIASTLSTQHGIELLGWLFLAVATGIFGVICVGFIRHRTPAFAPATMAPWGMVAMGILALGSAWAATTGNWLFQLASWGIGTPLAVVVCLNQLRKFPGDAPSFQWALALVGPMVAATSSGQLAAHIPWMKTVGQLCFVLTFITATPVFVLCYRAVLARTMVLPPAIAGTAWIPLGMVGQSTAAALLLFPATAAHIYGAAILGIGVPLALYAAATFYSAVAARADYSPGWWGSTFPVGTCCLGTNMLGHSVGATWLTNLSAWLLLLLLVHWAISAGRFLGWARA